MATKNEKEVEQKLPPLVNGEMATVMSVKLMEKKTRPPLPYTEGQLITDMSEAGKFLEVEESAYRKVLKKTSGLGTSATRDSIIENLKFKGLLESFTVKDSPKAKERTYIRSTKKGQDLIAYLPPALYDIATTARWEADLAVVEVQGGGAKLEAAVAQEAINMVAILKTHGRMERSEKPATHKKEKTSMSENQERGASSPTEKMLEYATKIAKAINQPLPDEVANDFEACKLFIDTHKEAANRPSEKQLKFAESIAAKKQLTIPPEALADAREISKWIDANK
jgi:hypothetical protein